MKPEAQEKACNKNRWLNRFRKWHKWPGIILGFFFILWAISGIVMNHRGLFSGLEISRKYLPKEYRYENWNNAAVKSGVSIGRDSILICGNIGVWLTSEAMDRFADFNAGFPEGIDNRKIFSLLYTDRGNLYAGTLFGLYFFDRDAGRWTRLELPVHDKRVQWLLEQDGEILVLTRSMLFRSPDDPSNFSPEKQEIPAPEGYDNKAGLFRTIWVIHSGEIYGMAGRLIVDALGLIVILLTVTGVIHFTMPYVMRRLKRQKKSTAPASAWKRTSARWHKKAGVWIFIFLLINTVTGMFLRPPLLITIASARVGKIPFSILDTPNPWADKLRAIAYDEALKGFILGTSEGIYFANEKFSEPLTEMRGQPPVSVMGINVLERVAPGEFLIGSFSGLFLWKPSTGQAIDVITGRAPPEKADPRARPIGEHMAAGYLSLPSGASYSFDYNQGAVELNNRGQLPSMPAQIIETAGMSWWNFALEVHTARIFNFLIGDFYILVVPLLGIFGTIMTISGLIVWIKLYARKNR